MRKVVCVFFLSLFTLTIAGKPVVSSEVVLYIFEGSDWCTNCARLEKKILSDPQFLHEIGLLHVKVERIDFPQRKNLPSEMKEYNDRIAEKFGFDGIFPTLILFMTDTDRSSRIYYHNESVGEMIRIIRNNLKLLYE
jgi:thiol-disulfide isomerase/thioredoxin